MKKFLFGIFCLTFSFAYAQDTIWVQTFTYDSISNRRSIFTFPPELQGEQFERVLMYYNLKCDPLTPYDSYNCGEWDYLAYSNIYDHLGVYDSNAVEMPQYLLNNAYTDPVEYVNNPYYDYYQNYEYFINYTSEVDNDYTIGAGTESTNYPFGTSNETQRSQILWTNAEIIASGISAGDIAKLRFDVNTLGGTMGHLKVRMKHTTATDINSFDESGWSTVYDMNTSFAATGINTINLTYPFNFDGISDILMDITWENLGTSPQDNSLTASNTTNNSVVYTDERLGHLKVEPGDHAVVELSNYDFQDEITISFWSKGDGSYLPVNTSILEGADSLNQRIANIHFPWSNGNMYWDCGEGNGYDRIYQAASPGEIGDEWHHWAFTKNAVTGEMNIYVDGVLWLNGTGLTKPVGVINKFILGANKNGDNNWAGLIDEFRIWDVELSPTEINNWMNTKVDATHPNYSDLVVYYDFDQDATIEDRSGNDRDAMTNNGQMIEFHSENLAGYTVSNVRPNVTFVQGTYTYTIDSTLILDSALVQSADLTEYQVDGSKFTIVDIQHFYPVGYSYLYDVNGNAIDSTYFGADVSFANDSLIYYDPPFELVDRYEIGRFITPYGIGFDLGPNGFTYVYDVTDYQSLLQGDVDLQAHNTQELIDVKFAFIVGTPPRDVLGVERLWDGRASYSYQSLDDDVNLSSTDVDLDPNGEMYKVRTRITGHGHNGNNNCCEWGQGREHEILVDGVSRFTWDIWQETECGDNPNTGQGGTWPYAREGWCPGDIVEEHEFDITPYVTPGTTTAIDYDITDVPTGDPDQGNGNYVIAMHMVTYGAPNFETDAAIVDILNPNDWEYYSKWNPTCQNPRIILKNTGSTTLTSAEINIWIGGFDNVITYNWTGSLEFLEETVVEIPVTPEWWYDIEGSNVFTARIYKANGIADEYAPNNKMSTTFEAPITVEQPFYIYFKTNNKAYENDMYLKDSDGNVIFERTSFTNNTEYRDTFELATGCYTLEVYDSDHDGLGYWYSNIPTSSGGEGETNGTLHMRKITGGMIKQFDRDFGHYTSYSFSVGYGVGLEEEDELNSLSVYPNPSSAIFNLTLDNFKGDNVAIEVYNELGELVYYEDMSGENPEGFMEKQLDLSALSDGLYILRVVSDEQTESKRIVIQ